MYFLFFGYSLVFARLVPVVIIPLFFKYKPISDTELRERIINLAVKMDLKILDVFEIDFSKKTTKANAGFVGWGKTKRVILTDTLKYKDSLPEIEVILAHEFAHYKLGHIFKLIIVSSSIITLSLYIIFKTRDYALRFFGLSSLSDIASFPVVLIYLILFSILSKPLENYISRRFEKQADLMALKSTGSKESFISMIHKLSAQNLADMNPPPLIKIFFFDHPPVKERIAIAKSF
ncbi:MAG: M48 family metalloprotease [Candidatus Omnitrophica bacterium]|nr:M48 family metalloprotease [Candidatus Omnitrophota bacterium]